MDGSADEPYVYPGVRARLRRHLQVLYPPKAAREAEAALVRVLAPWFEGRPISNPPTSLFSERDAILITYGDQFRAAGQTPLATLRGFVADHLTPEVSTVHLLPIHPWTSDDGFSVADFATVDPALGTWEDVRAFRPDVDLMLDAVVNHTSASHSWFRRFLAGDPAYEDFYMAASPQVDLTRVTRPRATPLLHPFDAVDGLRHVWTTFSADQVDLDYRNPQVLAAMTAALLRYVANGARLIRLDAIAFLWKQIGTPCVHLPQTHEVVKLWRTIVDAVSPGTLLITETNVPHVENVAYFGRGDDEAHLVYQFPLAPLVLHAFDRGNATTLRIWAEGLRTPAEDTTFFNFLGSHDGIGLRPVEGILSSEDVQRLVDRVQRHGGGVSFRSNPDGSSSPYELNTVYFDALNDPFADEPQDVQVDRMMASQSILLALAGVPGLYVHALLGSRNWREGTEKLGSLRAINRQKLDLESVLAELEDPRSLRHAVWTRMRGMLAVRRSEPAFHPNAPQRVLSADPGLLVIERTPQDGSSTVVCVTSVVDDERALDLGPQAGLPAGCAWTSLLGDEPDSVHTDAEGRLGAQVPPYGVLWLKATEGGRGA